MARYIDANLLKEVVLGWEPPLNDKQLEHEIDTMPTADVAEVVFCEECKHWGCVRSTMIGGRVGNCYNDGSPFHCEQPPVMKPTDFCSYGERREESEV